MTPAGTGDTLHGPVPYSRTERPERVRQVIRRERLAPSWLLASLVLATLGALLILYPKTYIEDSLRANPTPNAATLAYLQLMVRAHSDDGAAHILLAEQALTVGDIRLCRFALAPWLNLDMRRLPIRIAMLRLRLLKAEIYAASGQPRQRARLADVYVHDSMSLAGRVSPPTFISDIRPIASLGHPASVAILYRRFIDRTKDNTLRRQAFSGGIDVLLAAGQPQSALDFAQSELAKIPQDDAIWRRLIRLSLMANHPDLAAGYARRLVGMSRK